eukprot:511198-Pleurochrysis_carterae.AAC.1
MSIIVDPDSDDAPVVKKVGPNLWRVPCNGDGGVIDLTCLELVLRVRKMFDGDGMLRVAHGKPPCQVKKEMIQSGDGEDDDMMGLAFHTIRGCIDLTSGDGDADDGMDVANAQEAKTPSFDSVLLSLEVPDGIDKSHRSGGDVELNGCGGSSGKDGCGESDGGGGGSGGAGAGGGSNVHGSSGDNSGGESDGGGGGEGGGEGEGKHDGDGGSSGD